MIAHDIQKYPVLAIETTNTIMEDLENGLFFILLDESCYISIKEQTAIVVRYVDLKWHVIESFFWYNTC